MKKLVLLLLFGVAGPFAFAQNSFTALTVNPRLGIGARDVAPAFSLEYNLGKRLRKGFEVETGLGLQTRGVRFRYRKMSPEHSAGTLAVLPTRVRFRLNANREGKHQVWLNLGYIYGRAMFANGWALFQPENESRTNASAERQNFHFGEMGFEIDAPLGTHHRIGFGINYTRSLTPNRENRYFNSFLHLPGFRIRIARHRWGG
ncbi:MAG: hypothetical protein AAF998_26220 [Bacteroidota bacterium]